IWNAEQNTLIGKLVIALILLDRRDQQQCCERYCRPTEEHEEGGFLLRITECRHGPVDELPCPAKNREIHCGLPQHEARMVRVCERLAQALSMKVWYVSFSSEKLATLIFVDLRLGHGRE